MATPTTSGQIQEGLQLIRNILGLSAADPRLIAARIIRLSFGLLGILFVLLIMQAGLVLMVSGGKDEEVARAKKIFFNAIIGLVLILSAYSIVQFILTALTPK